MGTLLQDPVWSFGDIEDIGCGRQEAILADHSQGQDEQLKWTGPFLRSLKASRR